MKKQLLQAIFVLFFCFTHFISLTGNTMFLDGGGAILIVQGKHHSIQHFISLPLNWVNEEGNLAFPMQITLYANDETTPTFMQNTSESVVVIQDLIPQQVYTLEILVNGLEWKETITIP